MHIYICILIIFFAGNHVVYIITLMKEIPQHCMDVHVNYFFTSIQYVIRDIVSPCESLFHCKYELIILCIKIWFLNQISI